MSRALLEYGTVARSSGARDEAHSTDALEQGYFRLRRGAGSVYRPVAIWHGPPLDPVTGEELDRGHRWQVLFCGRFIWDEALVWPVCKGEPISRAEYDYLLARVVFAKEHDPRDPFAHPTGRVDWLESSPAF